ncbi:hypothetical protein AB0I84_49430 [Streptomyces spectabilis]|uniref:hypothetical protein n=1 Tax=Streptomyces spectabilis TaxID=68270 RepID=UPI003400B2DE
MTVLAVTGHMDLTEAGARVVRAALDRLLARHADAPPVGLSCIAAGADSLFADAVLDVGGKLVAVIPSRRYRQEQVSAAQADTFDRLRAAAHEVIVMPYESASSTAYEAANSLLLDRADRLVAVWDGSARTGKGGGTADVVSQARARGIPVDVVWPRGAERASRPTGT